MKASVFVAASVDGFIARADGHIGRAFLADGLIDELIVTRVPLLIGGGIALFGALAGDVRLRHVATRVYDNGLVQNRYRVVR